MYITLKNLNLNEVELTFIEFETENIKIIQNKRDYIVNYNDIDCQEKENIIRNIDNFKKKEILFGTMYVDNVKNNEKDCTLEIKLFEHYLLHDYFFEDEIFEEHLLSSMAFILHPVIIRNENINTVFKKYFDINEKNHKNISKINATSFKDFCNYAFYPTYKKINEYNNSVIESKKIFQSSNNYNQDLIKFEQILSKYIKISDEIECYEINLKSLFTENLENVFECVSDELESTMYLLKLNDSDFLFLGFGNIPNLNDEFFMSIK